MVDATEHPPDSLDAYTPLLVADRLVQFLFQQRPIRSDRGDLLIRPDVEGFTSLNFSPAEHRAAARPWRAAPRTRCCPDFGCRAA